MKIIYFDCQSGISGDMVLGALIDLGVPVKFLNDVLRSFLQEVFIDVEQVNRCGFSAMLAKVHAPHEHVHRHLSDILELVNNSSISEQSKENVTGVFRLIAEAESFVHGVDLEEVHFHEVGAADSIADIVGGVVGIEYLGVGKIYASEIPTGCGTIKIAHGQCNVPAPATAELLRGIPIAASNVPFELTTPTGAALMKYFVNQFGTVPAMIVDSIGTGAGSRDLKEQANILRIFSGRLLEGKPDLLSAAEQLPNHVCEKQGAIHNHKSQRRDAQADIFAAPKTASTETVWVLETNIDDSTGEVIGHCIDCLWNASPLDVWTTGIQMKKQRPGIMLSVLCRTDQVHEFENILFKETTTIGVRRRAVERTVLRREVCKMKTIYGNIDAKRLFLPDGTEKVSPEFESAKKLAKEKNVPVQEILKNIVKLF
ncbi:MAG: nickel pincer cofactor biosynthesis protein LarC [Planctomycetaceae bacterium]|jgi:uncharacterized protein (TIGR00299 family) protein|nr:nickel pincer cofactor biosynthesis protein LarC [Planctomycetaceae bacterium]